MKKLLAALLALLCLPVMTALGDTQGDFTYALTPEGAVVTMYYVCLVYTSPSPRDS